MHRRGAGPAADVVGSAHVVTRGQSHALSLQEHGGRARAGHAGLDPWHARSVISGPGCQDRCRHPCLIGVPALPARIGETDMSQTETAPSSSVLGGIRDDYVSNLVDPVPTGMRGRFAARLPDFPGRRSPVRDRVAPPTPRPGRGQGRTGARRSLNPVPAMSRATAANPCCAVGGGPQRVPAGLRQPFRSSGWGRTSIFAVSSSAGRNSTDSSHIGWSHDHMTHPSALIGPHVGPLSGRGLDQRA